jgi:hypothetical protein
MSAPMSQWNDDLRISKAMQQCGGSFVRKLGELIPLADDDNRATLRSAFPAYWAKYRQIAIAQGIEP